MFLRWRGEPPFGETQWEQLLTVADRVIVDSSEWDELRYYAARRGLRAHRGLRHRVGPHGRLADRARRPLAGDRRAGDRDQGPPRRGGLLRGWLAARLTGARGPAEVAGELGVRLDGEELAAPREEPLSPSDLLSAELDRLGRDRVYEAAVTSAN